MSEAVVVSTFLFENAPIQPIGVLPPRCLAADRLRWNWYRSGGDLRPFCLAELREHLAHCLLCLRIGAYNLRLAATAVHPDLTIEQIEGA